VTTPRDLEHSELAARALLESEQGFRSAFDYAAIGMALVGLDGSWLHVNEAVCELLGYSREELLETTFQDVTHPDDLEADLALVAELVAGELRTYQLEKRYFDKEGEVVWVLLSVSLVRDDDGNPEYFISQIQDISERKRAEADRDRLRDELHHAQKLEAIGRLAGGVAHDFNNMLTAIKGYSELLLEKLEPHTALHGHALQIKRAAEQASALPRQLLAFSRKQALEPELVDLSEIVGNIGELLQRLIGETITVDTSACRPAFAWVDTGQLEQVLVNLALNARDAMTEGGTLIVETKTVEVDEDLAAEHDVPAGRYSLIGVDDTGHGIDAETRARVFEPFFTTKAVGHGSGLGLASVYGTISQSGGFIRLESEPGQGARFEIYLPAADGVEAAASADQRRRAPGVLLAEDEEIVRDLAVSVLEGAGFEVRTAVDGLEALELFDACPGEIDVVVTDLVMPELSGRALAARIKERSPETPIVYMSGYTDEAADPQAPHDGGRFLQKPFSAALLVDAVRKAVTIDGEITCVVADDHPAVLDAVSQFLERRGIRVVAVAATGDEALHSIGVHHPSVALVDIAMKPLDGIEVAQRARTLSPDTRIVMYTGHRDAERLAQAREAGVCGFVLKEASLDDLAQALFVVAGGGTYVDPELAGLATESSRARAVSLTRREQEILSHLAAGKTNDKVAQELGISAETVQSHVHNAMGKLDAGTRTEAVATALRLSLIS
jgi:PAS domain S-box-containing protein